MEALLNYLWTILPWMIIAFSPDFAILVLRKTGDISLSISIFVIIVTNIILILVYWVNYKVYRHMNHKYDLNEKISSTRIGRFCQKFIKRLGYVGIIFASIVPFLPGFREAAIVQGILSNLNYAIYHILIFNTIRVLCILFINFEWLIKIYDLLKPLTFS